MSSDRRDELVLRMQLSPGPQALARVAQILAHRGIAVRSLVLSSAVGEPPDSHSVGFVSGAAMEIELTHHRDCERAVRFLARCVDVVSIDAGDRTDD